MKSINKIESTITLALWAAIVVMLFFAMTNLPLVTSPTEQLGASRVDKTSYDIIGTAGNEIEITNNFASSTRTILATYMDNFHLDVSFTPNANDTFMYLFVEVSNDGGENFFPLTTVQNTQTEILSFSQGEDGSLGIPIVFPGSKNTTSSLQYKGAIDLDIIADYVRISAKTSTGTSTAYVRGTVSAK
jgi:hypothetical protein